MDMVDGRDEEILEEFRHTINKHSRERFSDTPDFILAEYLMNCLRSYELAVMRMRVTEGRSDVG